MTRVVNIRDLPRNPADWPADHVYVGRANRARGLAGSRWCNPYVVSPECSRAEAVAAYEDWITGAIRREPDYFDLGTLRGKTLVCWCAPEGGVTAADLPFVCHGQVLARLADAT